MRSRPNLCFSTRVAFVARLISAAVSLTALGFAVRRNAVNCVQLLISDKRTDPNLKDNRGDSPLMVAVKHNRVACVELLLADPRVDLVTRDDYKRSEEEMAR